MTNGLYIKFFELQDEYECSIGVEAIYKDKPVIPTKNKHGFFDYIIAFVPFSMMENLQDTLNYYSSFAYNAMEHGCIFLIPENKEEQK